MITMRRRLFHALTAPENQSKLSRSHAAKSLMTGKPSRRMQAEISCLKDNGCEVRIHEVTVNGDIKNRTYRLGDISPVIHSILEKFARDQYWKGLFPLVDFFRTDK